MDFTRKAPEDGVFLPVLTQNCDNYCGEGLPTVPQALIEIRVTKHHRKQRERELHVVQGGCDPVVKQRSQERYTFVISDHIVAHGLPTNVQQPMGYKFSVR